MASRYFWVLLCLCIFSLFASWGLRLQYTIQELERALELQKEQQSNSLDSAQDQNTSTSVSKPRILCWILTGVKNHMTRAIHVKRTWGRRCDKLLFMSSVEDPRLGTVALKNVLEGHDKLWPKTQKAFQYIWEHHKNDADWFLKADDDTYVFVDNLRKFLQDYQPSLPHYFGKQVKFFDTAPHINFGGAGYVLSWEAVRRFVEIALVQRTGNCFDGYRPDYKADEDTEIGVCLDSVGVPAELSLDERGLERFTWVNPFQMFDNLRAHYKYLWNKGPLQASKRVITFHSINPSQLYVLEYLTHYMKADY